MSRDKGGRLGGLISRRANLGVGLFVCVFVCDFGSVLLCWIVLDLDFFLKKKGQYTLIKNIEMYIIQLNRN